MSMQIDDRAHVAPIPLWDGNKVHPTRSRLLNSWAVLLELVWPLVLQYQRMWSKRCPDMLTADVVLFEAKDWDLSLFPERI